jgi:hypothetical protein
MKASVPRFILVSPNEKKSIKAQIELIFLIEFSVRELDISFFEKNGQDNSQMSFVS